MAWYHNTTRFHAIVTLRITDAGGQDDKLQIGISSVMSDVKPTVGIHDVLVGPGEVIELSDGIAAEFLTVRSAE